MKVIRPQAYIESNISEDDAIMLIEKAGRVCYKSEDRIKSGSAKTFIRNILKRGHESVIEHVSVTVRVICDRGVSHEIVRHRIASYSQESTRYCNYADDKFGNEITVIVPYFFENTKLVVDDGSDRYLYSVWYNSCKDSEDAYNLLINNGASPQEARSVLPNSLKTEMFITMNLREWRHFFRLRCSHAAHPQMRQIANMILYQFKQRFPLFVEDIEV